MEYIKYKILNCDGFIYMNWIGKYTFGSIYCRGTRLHFMPEGGMILNVENQYIHKKDDLNLIGVFRRDEEIAVDNLNEIIHENWNDNFYELIDFNKINQDELNELDNEIINKIKTSDRILFDTNSELTHVIFDIKNVIDELKLINNIAKDNNVTFHWV